LAGKIIIDTETEQMIQILDEKEKGYPYPIPQLERLQKFMQKFLLQHNLPPVPVDYLITMHPSQINRILSQIILIEIKKMPNFPLNLDY
jgi:hypothetical protein